MKQLKNSHLVYQLYFRRDGEKRSVILNNKREVLDFRQNLRLNKRKFLGYRQVLLQEVE